MSNSEETIWDPNSSSGRAMPPSDFVLDFSRSRFSHKRKRTNRKDFYHFPQYHKPYHICEIHPARENAHG